MWLQLQKFVIRIQVAKANGMSQCSWNNAKKSKKWAKAFPKYRHELQAGKPVRKMEIRGMLRGEKGWPLKSS